MKNVESIIEKFFKSKEFEGYEIDTPPNPLINNSIKHARKHVITNGIEFDHFICLATSPSKMYKTPIKVNGMEFYYYSESGGWREDALIHYGQFDKKDFGYPDYFRFDYNSDPEILEKYLKEAGHE